MYVNVMFDSPIVLPSATCRTIRLFIVRLEVLILCFEDSHSDCCLPICQSAFNISSMALLFYVFVTVRFYCISINLEIYCLYCIYCIYYIYCIHSTVSTTVNWSIHLSIDLSIYLCLFLSIHPSIHTLSHKTLENTMFRNLSSFSRTLIFFLLALSSLTLSLVWSSFYWLLFFHCSHDCCCICPQVGNLTSKLPSIILVVYCKTIQYFTFVYPLYTQLLLVNFPPFPYHVYNLTIHTCICNPVRI